MLKTKFPIDASLKALICAILLGWFSSGCKHEPAITPANGSIANDNGGNDGNDDDDDEDDGDDGD